MNFYNIISKQPVCEICGKNISSWNPFAKKHYHNECLSDKVSTELINKITKNLNILTIYDRIKNESYSTNIDLAFDLVKDIFDKYDVVVMNNPTIIFDNTIIQKTKYWLYYVETSDQNLITEKIDIFFKNYKAKSIERLNVNKIYISNLYIVKCFGDERFHFTYAVVFEGYIPIN